MAASRVLTMTRGKVNALPLPTGGRTEYRDTVVPKLVLRVSGTSKVYYVYTRDPKTSREQKIRLGSSDEISPGEARVRARAVVEQTTPTTSRSLSMTPLLQHQDEFLTTREVAALMRMSSAWLEKCRWQGTGPPYIKCGRSVRYVKSQVLEWIVTQQ